jgi:hypothetical protein
MSADDQWLLGQGFLGRTEQDDTGEYWAHLIGEQSEQIIAPKYGRGPTAQAATTSARHRYESEQLGIPRSE